MAHIQTNEYTKYHLTDEEFEEGSKFTITQRQVIQNEIAVKAEELVTLVPDPSKPTVEQTKFIYEHAYCKGAMDVLMHLLNTSQSYDDSIVAEADLSPQDQDTPAIF